MESRSRRGERITYPPVPHPLTINEHTRGVSFYAPVEGLTRCSHSERQTLDLLRVRHQTSFSTGCC